MKKERAEKIFLEASVRTSSGKQAARGTRRRGWIPAVVYKQGENALAVEVPEKGLSRVLHTKAGENALITLQFGKESQSLPVGDPALFKGEGVVLIKELQHHPVSHQIIHVDFHQISLTKKITVTVPLAFKGEAQGVKQEGGVLEHLRWDLEVECLPTEIPDEIAVDIAALTLGRTLYVKDLALPPGVRAVIDPEHPVVGCVEPKAEEVPAAAEAAGEMAEPEVIKQKKPEEAEATASLAADTHKEKDKGDKAEAKKG